MLDAIIKNSFLLLCNIYVYQRILNCRITSTIYKARVIPYIFITAILAHLVNSSWIAILLLILFSVLFLSVALHTKLQYSFTTNLLSFAICYVAFAVASFIICSLTVLLFHQSVDSIYTFLLILIGILQYLIVHIPFQFKRTRKGMPFLVYLDYINAGALFSFFILICTTFLAEINVLSSPLIFCILLSILFAGLLLLFWWRSRLTRSYLDRLQRTELESLRNQVEEKEREIAGLIANNDALARIIHKDNKLIPAMELAVRDFLTEYKTLDSIQIEKKGQALLSSLSEMAQNRTGILHDYQSSGRETSSTGCCSIDAILSLMKNRALTAHIDFSVSLHADMSAFDSLGVSEEDLTHLLADLLDNALIAMREQPSGHLLVYFGYMKDAFVLEVSDSGAAFAPEVFQSFGLEKHSMHEDTGGSGIGLMDIWAIKKKYRCSLHIIEYPAFPATSSIPNYTKKLSFLFDHKNRYAIRTYRRKELQRTLLRNDLIVLSDS